MKRILYETPGNGKYIEFNYDKNVNENNLKRNPFRFYCGLLYLPTRECIHSIEIFHIWATSWQYQQNGMCAQQRLRSSWASTHSDQRLRIHIKQTWVLSNHLSAQQSSDQTGRMPRLICLCWAHMPFCWFCLEVAHFLHSCFDFLSLDIFQQGFQSRLCILTV